MVPGRGQESFWQTSMKVEDCVLSRILRLWVCTVWMLMFSSLDICSLFLPLQTRPATSRSCRVSEYGLSERSLEA
jgi:hypothetical protein